MMVSFTSVGPKLPEEPTASLPEGVDIESFELPGSSVLRKLAVFAEGFDLLPRLRRDLQATGLTWRETWHAQDVDWRTLDVHLFRVRMYDWSGASSSSEPVVTKVKCPRCGRVGYERRPHDSLTVDLAADPPDAFVVPDSGATLLRRRLFTELKDQGLAEGLAAVPVVARGAGGEWVSVYSDRSLGPALTPFGTEKTPCSVCDRALPRYGFYPSFAAPGEPRGWYVTEWFGHGALVVGRDVRDWLASVPFKRVYRDEGAAIVLPLGLFPEDESVAFLSAEHRGIADG